MVFSKFGLLLCAVYLLILAPSVFGIITLSAGSLDPEFNLLRLTLPGSLAVAIPGGIGVVKPWIRILVYLGSIVLNLVVIYFLGYYAVRLHFWLPGSNLKTPLLIYLLLGLILGWVSLTVLPRFGSLDKIANGMGLYLPLILLFLVVCSVLFHYDSSSSQNKLIKSGVMAIADAATIIYIISTIRIGF